MNRVFRAGRYTLPLGEKTYIMGICNVTPDSFSDGGEFFAPDNAIAHALQMQQQGADVIDIGGQSTRPGYQRISPREEWERLAPVLEGLRGRLQVPLSVDTFYPEVAALACEHGADIINDVSGFSQEMWEVAAQYACGCVVMHPCGEEEEILQRVHTFFLGKQEEAARYGIASDRLCMDPGIGFGKTYEQNLSLIRRVEEYRLPDCMLLMAASRKRGIGQPCGNPPFRERMAGTLAAHTAAQLAGADMLRVHDVEEAVQAARVTDALLHLG